MGTGNTRIHSKWVSGDLYFRPDVDDTGAIYFGDGTRDQDVKIYLGSTSEYVEFNVGDSKVNMVAPVTIGTSTTDGVSLTDAVTAALPVYSDVTVALTASTVVMGTHSFTYMNLAQDADVDIHALVGELRVNQDLNDGITSGVWGRFYQTGSVSTVFASEQFMCGVRATIQVNNDFDMTGSSQLTGVLIESEIATSATLSGTVSSIYVQSGTNRLDFNYGIQFEDCLDAGVFAFVSSGTIVNDSADGAAGTASGYLSVKCDGGLRYIYLWKEVPGS